MKSIKYLVILFILLVVVLYVYNGGSEYSGLVYVRDKNIYKDDYEISIEIPDWGEQIKGRFGPNYNVSVESNNKLLKSSMSKEWDSIQVNKAYFVNVEKKLFPFSLFTPYQITDFRIYENNGGLIK